jgi:hypothetical protein
MRHATRPLRLRALSAWLSLTVAITLIAAITPAQADVLVREKNSTSGIMGMGSSEGQVTMILSGEKQQTETEMTIQGMPAGMGGDGPRLSVDIVRLDKDLIWHLDMPKKEYTEMSFAEMKQMMKSAKAEWSKQTGMSANPEDLEFSVSVETPGAKKEINGFATEQKILHIAGQAPGGEGATGEISITADMWVAKDVPGYDELRAFQSGFAKKVGIDLSMFQSAGGMAQMMGGSVGRLAEEMQKLDGYPILMVMTIELSGVEGAAGMPEAMGEIDMQAMMEAAKSGDMAALEKMKADMEKKAKEMEANPSSSGGKAALSMTVRHEVTAITTTDVPQVGFDIPEGFNKVEQQMPFQMPGHE